MSQPVQYLVTGLRVGEVDKPKQERRCVEGQGLLHRGRQQLGKGAFSDGPRASVDNSREEGNHGKIHYGVDKVLLVNENTTGGFRTGGNHHCQVAHCHHTDVAKHVTQLGVIILFLRARIAKGTKLHMKLTPTHLYHSLAISVVSP